MATPLGAGSCRTLSLPEPKEGKNAHPDAGSEKVAFAAHIAIWQCLLQSGIGVSSGQHGIPSGIAEAVSPEPLALS